MVYKIGTVDSWGYDIWFSSKFCVDFRIGHEGYIGRNFVGITIKIRSMVRIFKVITIIKLFSAILTNKIPQLLTLTSNSNYKASRPVKTLLVQSAKAVEYTVCISAEA